MPFFPKLNVRQQQLPSVYIDLVFVIMTAIGAICVHHEYRYLFVCVLQTNFYFTFS